jgi:hypothetical protein
MKHVIASYNMSWASATGLFKDDVDKRRSKPSEAGFLRRARKKHEFWQNAFDHLMSFIKKKEPSVIGLQEMIQDNPGGLQIINAVKDDYYHLLYCVSGACILTLWKKSLGKIDKKYSVDLEKGRPMSMIYTTKKYLLINLHAPHLNRDAYSVIRKYLLINLNPSYSHNGLADLIDIHFKRFVGTISEPLDSSKIYIMGDFNYDGINRSHPFILNDSIRLSTGTDREIKSCCYGSRATTPHDYPRGGDYCLGQYPVVPLHIIPSPIGSDHGSIASDHELVSATFRTKSGSVTRKRPRINLRKTSSDVQS